MSRICAVNVETRKTLTYGFLLSFFVHFTFLCDSIFCQQALRLEIDTLKSNLEDAQTCIGTVDLSISAEL